MLALMNSNTRLVALTHVSNALGTINPIKTVIDAAHDKNIPVLIDGAQGIPHSAVDVQTLGCDFYAFSGHKMYGPTGIGVLYGREEWLDKLPPWQGGGEMILSVSFENTVYNKLPYKFEAGTPNIAGAIGLGAAIDYLQNIGLANIAAWEAELLDYMTAQLSAVPNIRLIGTAADKAGVQSFLINDIHPHDLGTVIDHKGVAIRTGHHCAEPVMEFYGISGTARASLAFYNNREDVDQLIEALGVAQEMFS
jgi:cysteine desulfurase/selenocysteine lyase